MKKGGPTGPSPIEADLYLLFFIANCHNHQSQSLFILVGTNPCIFTLKSFISSNPVFHRDLVKMIQIGLVLLDDKFLLTLLTKE